MAGGTDGTKTPAACIFACCKAPRGMSSRFTILVSSTLSFYYSMASPFVLAFPKSHPIWINLNFSADGELLCQGCEWLSQETSLGLPAFPPFPVDNEFKLPPLPRLLPMWDVLRQLQSLMHEQEPQQAFELAHMFRSSASTADKSWAITSVAGASAGLATGLILSTWLALRRRRCHGERCITRAS